MAYLQVHIVSGTSNFILYKSIFPMQIQMQADPTQAGMWKPAMTQDGQVGVTVPAPPPYSPPQGPWYTAPIVTVRINTDAHIPTLPAPKQEVKDIWYI